ncbi:hypothetical protein [Cytophaga hutchinsonii]|jgi:hypothetical protein|uniref:Lipoprotein n=1 Tax=Cytophaga hutchinsonii (strain ATCC 33406 / DSM 1761 / CIP 103989 / NBRC 15051 / NCIMB 9469 / D465) TaxID=269798 RepID=A0A6N4STU0_CYTH3|nr:hypothetical protein [Cytophaga hutchinsonii]ABG59851.1 hypothetical protein CHU_2598 [Cytophaga hutchinsonii ATCC 33406]SFX28743.1 hypothetical protein SAMN04487930_102453 [Cytophaga hutchinsonii ATCC 33406]
MKKIFIIVLILITGITSCTESETDGTQQIDSIPVVKIDTIAPVAIDTTPIQKKVSTLQYTAEDATHLLLFEKFSLGISYDQLKDKLPAVKPLHAEDFNEQLGKKGLQESLQDISFLKYKGKLEFNFKNDTLVRYSIVFNESNDTKGYALYEKILNYYSDQLGSYQLVNIEEDNHYAQTNMWYLNPDYLVAVYNLNTGNITIAAQTYKPGQ